MNDYASHDFKHRETCREAGVFDYKASVREIRKEVLVSAFLRRQDGDFDCRKKISTQSSASRTDTAAFVPGTA
jgi:hypothetical protein